MQRGYTFIEVLITMSLMLLFIGLGIAAFDRFNDRQKVVEAAIRTQNMMRSAQVKARTGDKPDGCVKLLSYRVNLTANSGNVGVSAVCTTPDVIIARENYSMPPGVVVESTQQLDFVVLSGGVTASPALPSIIIKSSNNQWRYAFGVDIGGAVGEGAFQ